MGFNYKSIDINLPDVKKFLGEASSNTDFDNDFWYFNASKSNSIYGNSNTVQPPAIKVRVYTRWK